MTRKMTPAQRRAWYDVRIEIGKLGDRVVRAETNEKRLRAAVRKLRSALRDICAMTYNDNVSAADIEVVAEKALRRKRGGA